MDAKTVLNQSRDVDPAFDKQSTPDAVALRFLARYQQHLLSKIAHFKRDALHTAQTIALPLANFAAGTAINAHLSIHGVSVSFTDANRDPEPVRLVEYPLKLDPYHHHHYPTAYIRARTLFLLGEADDWTDMKTVTIDLFPAGNDAITMTEALLLPGSAQRACVDAVAGFMAARAKVKLNFNPLDSEDSYLDEVTERRRAKVGTIREFF